MKKSLPLLAAALALTLTSANAQPGPHPGMGGPAGPRGTQFTASMAKLFGQNSAFSAMLENHVQTPQGEMVVPGKISFDNGKSRFEMDMSAMKSPMMNDQAAAHMKMMGMDKMTMISRPDLKAAYMIYPGIQAYSQMTIQDPEAGKSPTDFKIETTELGKETVAGHPCIKNKAVVTDSQGTQHESTVWNATDLKNFPVKIETTEHGQQVTMLFKDVSLSKPADSEFDPPSDYKKYNSMQEMMQAEMMKRMGGMGGPGGMGAPGGGMTPPPKQ